MIARVFLTLAVLFAPVPAGAVEKAMTAHDFTFDSIDGAPLPLSAYRGKVVLVVNTASFCGYTHQYDDLQALWEGYRDRGLIVLGVPSNDFGAQEPGSAAEIKQFCEVNFSLDFPLAAKEHVTGAGAHPFYKWALGELGASAAPRWNFHKYLVGADGALAGWFATATSPTSPEVSGAIEAELGRRPNG